MLDELDESTLKRLKAIFSQATDYLDPDERQRYIDGACGEDARLLGLVERLLKADSGTAAKALDAGAVDPFGSIPEAETPPDTRTASPSTNEFPAVSGDETTPPLSREVPKRIGPYKPLQKIGEGGMGIVYLAEQHKPVRRRVALKVIKPGMDSRQVIARFEAERQAMAMMDHPHIARALDAGQTDTGLPYFVMELVHGVPINQFCEQASLPLEGRLRLFQDVCSAVQHAHVRGVIHRDLKPSNVLVTMHDDRPVVKVIDFGVAKAIGQPLTERTLFTGFNQVVGTILYMSPEQAKYSGTDVDTRSDVYSLGVLLYELLTGTLPFDRQELENLGLEKFRKLLIHTDPPSPSKRLRSSRESALKDPSAERELSGSIITPGTLRGELDWIVMKALEKDRQRRYQSAAALSADIQRHLDNEPIEAGPASMRYRIGKWFRRNRGVSLATAATVLVLLIAVGFLLVSNAQIQAEQQRTQIAKDEATDGLAEAQKQLERADANLQLTLEALDAIFSGQNTTSSIHTIGQVEVRTEAEMERLRYCLRFYEQLSLSNKSNSDIQFESAKAHVQFGLIQLRADNSQGREIPFRNALWVAEQLLAQDPEDPRRRLLVARCQHGWVEAAYLISPKNATQALSAAKSHEPLARQSAATRRELYETFDLERDAYNEPSDFVNILWIHSAILRNLGRHEESEAVAREASEVVAKLVKQYPAEPIYRHHTAYSHRILGEVLQATGNGAAAARHYRQAITIYEQLIEEFPSITWYRRESAEVQQRLATHLTAADDPEDLVETLWNVVRLYQGLIKERPEDRTDHWREFRQSYEMLLTAVSKAPDFQESALPLQETLNALRPLTAIHPQPDQPREFLAKLNFQAADLCRKAKLADEAIRFCQQNDEVLSDLSEGPLKKIGTCRQAIEVYRMWGELLEGKGAQEEAKLQFQRAAEAEGILANFDHVKAEVAKREGLSLLESGDPDGAVERLQRSAELYPHDRNVNLTLGILLSNRGDIQAARQAFVAGGISYAPLDSDYHSHVACNLLELDNVETANVVLRGIASRHPVNPFAYQVMALIQIVGSDQQGYRQTCAKMRQQFEEEADQVAETLWTCGLAPEAVEDYAPLLRLAESLRQKDSPSPTEQIAAAAIVYRAGSAEAAIEHLNEIVAAEATDEVTSPAFAAYFLAMAHHHAQDPEKARKWLDKAQAQAAAEEGQPSTCLRRMILKILHSEAQSLLESPPEDDSDLRPSDPPEAESETEGDVPSD